MWLPWLMRGPVLVAFLVGLLLGAMLSGGPYRISGGGQLVWRVNAWTGQVAVCAGGYGCVPVRPPVHPPSSP